MGDPHLSEQRRSRWREGTGRDEGWKSVLTCKINDKKLILKREKERIRI